MSRKWATFTDAYKRVRDNNNTTGQGTIKFHFYSQISELLQNNHDVDFPVIGTGKGVKIVRPEALSREPQSHKKRSGSLGNSSTLALKRNRKGKGQQAELCDILREAESAKQKRFDQMFTFMQQAHADCKHLMQAMLDKE